MTSVVTKEIQVYLDSDTATQGTTNLSQTSDGNYSFEISPPIVAKSHLEKNFIYLKQFSCLNTVANIPAQTFTVRTKHTSEGEDFINTYERSFGHDQNISDPNVLALTLNQLGLATSTPNLPNIPSVAFQYEKFGSGHITVLDVFNATDGSNPRSGIEFQFSGKVFELMNFPTEFLTISQINAHIRAQAPFSHYKQNLYLTCNQLLDSNPHTCNEIPNKLSKIMIDVDYGSYLQYEATPPVMKCQLVGQLIDKLSFRIYDDDYNFFKPDRFFITIAVETHKAIVEHPKSYWVKDTTNSLIQEQYDSRHPPVGYQYPNVMCPQTNRY